MTTTTKMYVMFMGKKAYFKKEILKKFGLNEGDTVSGVTIRSLNKEARR